jgi:RimJ/RimL family protein N-acetyltransferase
VLSEVPPRERSGLAALFEATPGWRGLAAAILSGEMGEAYASGDEPWQLAVLKLGFENLVGGESTDSAMAELFAFLPPHCMIVVPPAWNEALEARYAPFLTPERRVAFRSPAAWDRRRLMEFMSLASGFSLRRIDKQDIEAFATIESDLIRNFSTREGFLQRGVGFGVYHGGRFISGASSFAVGGGKLEIEIDTRLEYRRRGFATATGAALVLHCLDAGIEPCWDAANEASAALARKLGFVEEQRYMAYYVHPVPVNPES